MSTNKLLFGTDPEMAAVYEKDGKLYALPPYYFRKVLGVNASDDDRHPVFIETSFGKLHEDGAAFEMSIYPSEEPRELFDRIQEMRTIATEKILRYFGDDCQPELVTFPTVGFDVERWKGMPEDFHMSTRFGCDPDEDAFRTRTRARVEDASKHPYRYLGGHMHFSGSEFIRDNVILAIQLCAITVGVAAVAESDVPELEKLRTYRYGRPGKFRQQYYGEDNPFGPEYAYGVEYRTPSARWTSSWERAEKLFNWAKIALTQILPKEDFALSLVDECGREACDAILNANQEKARQVLAYVSGRI